VHAVLIDLTRFDLSAPCHRVSPPAVDKGEGGRGAGERGNDAEGWTGWSKVEELASSSGSVWSRRRESGNKT